MDASLRLLQTVRRAMMLSILLYVYVAETVSKKPVSPTPPKPAFYFGIGIVAVAMMATTMLIRRLAVAPSAMKLATDANDVATLTRWRAGYIFTYALCEAVALFGLILRIAGFGLTQVLPFYVAGLLLMIYFAPIRPSSDIG